MKMKRRRGVLGLLIACLGVGILVRYVMRDLRLDVDLLRESLMRMPGIVMENLEFDREISGDRWIVRLPFAEKRDEQAIVRSIDIRRRIGSGGEWYFFGAHGVYSHDERTAAIQDLLGTLETPDRVLNLESPGLEWRESRNEFFFPQGFTLYDDEFALRTLEASLDESGVMLLEKGGTVTWTKPLD